MVFIGIILLVLGTAIHIVYGFNAVRRPVERGLFFVSELNMLLTFISSLIIAIIGGILVWVDTNLIVALIFLGGYWMIPKYIIQLFFIQNNR